ncbi:hypothetical protein JCM19296_867 [Nonlabens ulvanivorans]|uniref:Uncharacterized protein n=1 Tax=Nonlabens ulvanivorans TaxID=906888 RepID=A0A081D8P3_NONUL|nr:hypothetical protein [Nonlabens ulvanivorans]GAK75289.1 hypothetical protein JCM19296_867 [Nonlabens ulvanivorans]
MAAALVMTTSCDSDDDLPVSQPIQVNTFCYGDQTTNFETIGAIREEPQLSGGTGVLTEVTVLGDGLQLNDMDEIEGAGVLMQINFYGNSVDNFQTGLYQIASTEEPADASLSYSLDFDSTSMLNASVELESGFIRVETYQTGYAITVDGLDTNGDEFHGVYLGNVALLQ